MVKPHIYTERRKHFIAFINLFVLSGTNTITPRSNTMTEFDPHLPYSRRTKSQEKQYKQLSQSQGNYEIKLKSTIVTLALTARTHLKIK